MKKQKSTKEPLANRLFCEVISCSNDLNARILARSFIKKTGNIFYEEDEEKVLQKLRISSILNLSASRIRWIANHCSYSKAKLEENEIHSFRRFLQKVQKKFSKLGIQQNSSFMKLTLLPRTGKEVAEYITQNWPIAPQEAEKFVSIAKRLRFFMYSLVYR